MACACGGSSARSAQGAQTAAAGSGRSPYQFEVMFNDGTSTVVKTEAEAIGALMHKGGGYRQVPS